MSAMMRTATCLQYAWASFVMTTVLAVPSAVATDFKSIDDLSKWTTYYYEHPAPDRVPEAVSYMSQSGLLNNESAVPGMVGFLSGVFHDNPEQVDTSIAVLRGRSEKHLGVVIAAVWYANLPDSRARVHALLEEHPALKPNFEYVYRTAPKLVEDAPIEIPIFLDVLWGKFMATGSSAPVERIIGALPRSSEQLGGEVNRVVIRQVARWSLRSNAVQHKRVLEICETALNGPIGDVSAALSGVIEEAKNERQKRQQAPAGRAPRDEGMQQR